MPRTPLTGTTATKERLQRPVLMVATSDRTMPNAQYTKLYEVLEQYQPRYLTYPAEFNGELKQICQLLKIPSYPYKFGETTILIACPKEYLEQPTAGVWGTVRWASRNKHQVLIIYPDGTCKGWVQRANPDVKTNDAPAHMYQYHANERRN